ncbi:MAG TPA: cupin domain-containing protein [Lacunisphaera sp.]|nr:cupin domain-containing protein [Lacunisphaera sp.]
MNRTKLSPGTHTAEQVAELLQLAPLEQEGGYFRRVAEAEAILPGSDRRAWSAIYFLVTPEGFSAMHQLDTDEIWSFLAGDPLESLRLAPVGTGCMVQLGANPAEGQLPLDVVPARTWQGTRLRPGGRWALVSCVVAPEFRWSDFVLGERAALTAAYPAFSAEIRALTRG